MYTTLLVIGSLTMKQIAKVPNSKWDYEVFISFLKRRVV